MSLRFIIKYLNYIFTAKHKRGHGIHSPFVFDLIVNVIGEKKAQYYAYPSINSLRYQLSKSNISLNVMDLGAGSLKLKKEKRQIKEILNTSCIKTKYGKLLFRLVNRFQPETILEFGTCLGLSALFMAAPSSKAMVYTIEGCPELSKIAKQNFELLRIKNIKIITGDFDNILPRVLEKSKQLDFVFFDGNHKQEATIDYFEQCLSMANENSIFVFDDIYWSAGMEAAWKAIKEYPEVTVTVDLFFMGLVFFKKSLSKQNFVVRF